MSKTILRNARLLDPLSRTDRVTDILLCDGIVDAVCSGLPETAGAEEIDAFGQWVFPGLVDMHVHLRVPGGEESETLESGLKAAIAGGITTVGMMPNTTPPIDNPLLVEELLDTCRSYGLADVVPVPCVTRGRKGGQLVDFEALHECGANAFTDDGSPVADTALLAKALKRTDSFGGVIIEHPEISELAGDGIVNEGPVAGKLSAGGIPEAAEFLDVQRCIDICSRSGGRIHLTHLSSPESIRIAAAAVSGGKPVTCDVTPHHLVLQEEDVLVYGSNAKMNPPLRSEKSRAELVRLVSRGFVSAVTSDHAPHAVRLKDMPVAEAAFGITGLETLLPLTLGVLMSEGGMSPLAVIRLLTVGPALVLGIDPPSVAIGSPADLVLFDPEQEYTLAAAGTFSRSRNTPFLNRKLQGRVTAVWKGGLVYREGSFAV